jgi:hypothetical protein
MGYAVLAYVDRRTTQGNGKRGLNLYNLSDANFRLWMAIKVLADQDTNMYYRSLAGDNNLFN